MIQNFMVELIAPFVSRITKFDLALDFELIGYKYHALGVGRSPGVEAFSNSTTSFPGPFPYLEYGAPRTQDREKALGTR